MRTRLLAILATSIMALAGCADSGSSDATGEDTHDDHDHNGTVGPGNLTNTAPTAALEADALNGTAPLLVNFTLNGTDADGDNLTWQLTLNDTVLANGTVVANGTVLANGTGLPATANATFQAAGNHTIVFAVSDGLNTTTTNLTVVVLEGVTGPCGEEEEPCIVEQTTWAIVWSDGRCDATGGDILPLDDGPGYIHDRKTGTVGIGFYGGEGTWAFEESNGIPGLQLTQDGSEALDEQDPVAVEWGCLNGDTLLF